MTPSLKSIITKTLRIALPLCVSAAMIIWLFRKIDFDSVTRILSSGIDYRYLLAMMGFTALSYVVRGIRWGIQLRAAGLPRLSVATESVSIFSAYALNLLVPFLGEAWRCVYIARISKAKVSTVVGTDLGDRISDAIMVLLVLVITLIVAHPQLMSFLDKYPLGQHLAADFSNPWLWISIGVTIAIIIAALLIWRSTQFVKRITASLRRLWQGFAVIFHMRGTAAYILLTFGIWGCYFMSMYVCFFAFPFTRQLIHTNGYAFGLIPALVAFLFGSFSVAVPSNGGLGPWNIAVMFALALFGVGKTDGAAFSIMCWSFQTAIIIALGIFSAFYIMLAKKTQKNLHI